MKRAYRKGRCSACGKDVVRVCEIDDDNSSIGGPLTAKCSCCADEVMNDATLRWFSDGTLMTWDEEPA